MKIEFNLNDSKQEKKSFLFREVQEEQLPWIIRGPRPPLFVAIGPFVLILFGLFTFLAHWMYPDKPEAPEFIIGGIILLVLIPIAWKKEGA